MLDRWRKARRFLEDAEARRASVPERSAPSLAREAVIAVINPADGKPWNGARYVVPAALLVELTREGRLQVSGTGRRTRVAVRDTTPVGDQELDDALESIGSGAFGAKVTRLVSFVPQTEQLLARLVADGVLEEESGRRLGMFPVRRYRPTPAARRDELVARLRSALLGESVPDDRTALLIAVLVGVHLKLFVPKDRIREAYRRAEEIRASLGADERAIVSAVQVALTDAND